ncbi:MAG: Rho termination factor N-terminal domain-containing protein, partial [Actinomycetota bacterium]|nr:Rho termination factor N-terminal domain-containing protein [Actinomycetota bacterium]
MAAEALEQSVLEAKDKDQLLAIAKALGVKASARTKKSDLIDQILETTGSSSRLPAEPTGGEPEVVANDAANERESAVAPAADRAPASTPGRRFGGAAEPLAEWELALDDDGTDGGRADTGGGSAVAAPAAPGANGGQGRDTTTRPPAGPGPSGGA